MASEHAGKDDKAALFRVADCPTSAAFIASSYWAASAGSRRRQYDALAHAVAGGIDGRLFAQLQRRHRTGGLNLRALRQYKCLGAFDAASRQDIIAHERSHRLKMLNLCAQDRRLTALFSAAGISARLLKGPRLSQWLYEDPCLRHSRDLDYWVAPHQAKRAVDLLTRQGFRLHERDRRFLQRWPELILDGYEIELLPPEGGYSVEVHWRIEESLHAVYEPYWRDVLDSRGRDGEFLYLIWHGARHRWARLKWLADIAGWLDKDSGVLERTRGAQQRLRLVDAVEDCLAVLQDVGLVEPSTQSTRPSSRRPRIVQREAARSVLHREALPSGVGEILRRNGYHWLFDARLPTLERAGKLLRGFTRSRWVFAYVPLPRCLPVVATLSPLLVAVRCGFKAVRRTLRTLRSLRQPASF